MEVNGWRLYWHPLLEWQVKRLLAQVEKAGKDGSASPAAKLLKTISRYIGEIIPRDPNSSEFRQGNALGPENRHWFRAKFHQRYRLFYRFSSQAKVIVYVWVNDEDSLRKAGSKTDPYTTFRSMLKAGNPPASFAELLKVSRAVDLKPQGGAKRRESK
jgi:toxin YhaV